MALPYVLTKSFERNQNDPLDPIVIDPNEERTGATSLALYGRGNLRWGEGVDENVLRLTENWASSDKDAVWGVGRQPDDGLLPNPIVGQTWFNNSNNNLYYYIATDSYYITKLERQPENNGSPPTGSFTVLEIKVKGDQTSSITVGTNLMVYSYLDDQTDPDYYVVVINKNGWPAPSYNSLDDETTFYVEQDPVDTFPESINSDSQYDTGVGRCDFEPEWRQLTSVDTDNFVLKTGDTMSGNLNINHSEFVVGPYLKITNPSTAGGFDSIAPRVILENAQNVANTGFPTSVIAARDNTGLAFEMGNDFEGSQTERRTPLEIYPDGGFLSNGIQGGEIRVNENAIMTFYSTRNGGFPYMTFGEGNGFYSFGPDIGFDEQAFLSCGASFTINTGDDTGGSGAFLLQSSTTRANDSSTRYFRVRASDGEINAYGPLDMQNNVVTNVGDPINSNDAMSREYADNRYLRLDTDNDPLTASLRVEQNAGTFVSVKSSAPSGAQRAPGFVLTNPENGNKKTTILAQRDNSILNVEVYDSDVSGQIPGSGSTDEVFEIQQDGDVIVRDGDFKVSNGDIELNSNRSYRIHNVRNPGVDGDVATKEYVDDEINSAFSLAGPTFLDDPEDVYEFDGTQTAGYEKKELTSVPENAKAAILQYEIEYDSSSNNSPAKFKTKRNASTTTEILVVTHKSNGNSDVDSGIAMVPLDVDEFGVVSFLYKHQELSSFSGGKVQVVGYF